MSGFKIRDEMNGVAEAPGKTWFWELEESVIDADRCIQCGACVAVCPSDSIGIGKDELPVLEKMCTGCSLCWDFCPRGGLRHEATERLVDVLQGQDTDAPATKITGNNSEATAPVRRYTARARKPASTVQDGGIVTAILSALLRAGEIDAVLCAKESETEPWKGEPFVACTPEELEDCAGSFYNNAMALGRLDQKTLNRRGLGQQPRLAVVGTPCEIEGIRAMQSRPWFWGSSRVDCVVLSIALLCTKSFNYEKLMVEEVSRKRDISLEDIGRVDVLRGKLIVQDKNLDTLLEEPIKNFASAALKGCDECADFLGNAADISVGSVGSADGYSSLLVRTHTGVDALDKTHGDLELRDLDQPEALSKLENIDKKTAFKTLKRSFDPDAPLFIDYQDHIEDYAATDRAPVVRNR
jgi:coenzyme F420 hydrogenase subunit beta